MSNNSNLVVLFTSILYLQTVNHTHGTIVIRFITFLQTVKTLFLFRLYPAMECLNNWQQPPRDQWTSVGVCDVTSFAVFSFHLVGVCLQCQGCVHY